MPQESTRNVKLFPSVIEKVESKSLSSQNNEIVWEYKCEKMSFSYIFTLLHLVAISTICFIFLFKGIDKFLSKNNTDFFTTILLVIMALMLLYPFYTLFKLLNLKKIYITKEHFVLTRYFGRKSIVPLGSFFIHIQYSGYGFIVNGDTTECGLHSINPNLKIRNTSFLMTNAKDNIDELYSLLLPNIEKTILNLDENDYIQCSFFIQTNIQPQIDWEKLNILRKEKYDK